MDNPLVLLALIGVVIYVGYLWLGDYRAAQSGAPREGALPGATRAPARAIWLAVAGSVALLGIEVAGEYRLGIVDAQTTMTWLFALYALFAAFGEEVMFRGFVVVERRGRALLLASVVAGSLVFALLHGHWYESGDDGFRVLTDGKSLFSTTMLFLGSLWFYAVRFWGLNPQHSLIPCVAAHLAKNVGVIAVKLSQGHVSGLY